MLRHPQCLTCRIQNEGAGHVVEIQRDIRCVAERLSGDSLDGLAEKYAGDEPTNVREAITEELYQATLETLGELMVDQTLIAVAMDEFAKDCPGTDEDGSCQSPLLAKLNGPEAQE